MAVRTADVLVATNRNGTGSSTQVGWPGGRGLLTVEGTFGASTLTFEHQSKQTSNWITAISPTGAAISMTAGGDALFELPDCQVRITMTGGAPTGIYATISRVLVG